MNIILFGATGMLGRYVYYNLKESYNVICIKREQFDIENDEWSKLQYLLCDNLKENDLTLLNLKLLSYHYYYSRRLIHIYIL